VLRDPNDVVVTETAARTLFDVRDGAYETIVGNSLTIPDPNDTPHDFTVTGVAADPPNNSSLQFEVLISFENYDDIRLGGNNWGGRTSTYVLLNEGQDPEAFEEALVPFVDTQFADYRASLRDSDFLAEGDDAFRMFLQPLPELHLSPEVWTPYEVSPHNPLYSYILGGIGGLVLLIACINFMTLSLGRSTDRAREVGVRKSLGADRGQLARQFWGEALILTAASLGVGVGLAAGALPFFNDLTGQTLSLTAFSWTEMVLGVGGLVLLVGGVAGGYPAWVLSKFRAAQVLKGSVTAGRTGWFSRGLVVLQYTIAIMLIVTTVLMAQQLDYLLHKDLGYDEEHVLVVHAGQVPHDKASSVVDRFRTEVGSYDAVEAVERTGYSFTRGSDAHTWQNAQGTTRRAHNLGVGVDYLDLMDIELVKGRNFSRQRPSDSTQSVLVNEVLVREFGLENPIGKKLQGYLEGVFETPPEIIGVVENFHFQSLHNEVEPVILNMHPDYYNYLGDILVRVKPGRTEQAVERARQTWTAALPAKPFTYSFLDEDLESQYHTLQRWSSILTYAALFAIFIACLGLFGLATLAVARRTKEIGIRKAVGASASSLMTLVTKDFAALVAIAMVGAWPAAYVFAQWWLANFAYRIDMPWWAFPAAGVGALAIAMLTVSVQALRAARIDPARVLRNE
jgi:putative ABC transport system permease protein